LNNAGFKIADVGEFKIPVGVGYIHNRHLNTAIVLVTILSYKTIGAT
jgi:hypothetical protein